MSGIAAALATQGWQPVQAADASTLESNKALVRLLFTEPLSAGSGEAIRDVYATDYRDRGAWARKVAGLAGMPSTIVSIRETHPELTVTVDALIAEADWVATVATWTGSHPPAGTHRVGQTIHLFRLAKGQIVEEWRAG